MKESFFDISISQTILFAKLSASSWLFV